MTVREYTEEFYKVNIISGHIEDTPERVARYVNGLRFDIQDELSLLSLRYVEEAYQVALKVEEKLMRRQSQKAKVRGSGGKEQQQKGEASISNQQVQPDRNNENRGGRNASRGICRGRGGKLRCYTCGKLGHMSWDYPKNVATQRGAQVVQVELEAPKELQVVENYLEQGEANSSNQQAHPDRTNDNRDGRNTSRGTGRGRGGQVRCYTCRKLVHMS